MPSLAFEGAGKGGLSAVAGAFSTIADVGRAFNPLTAQRHELENVTAIAKHEKKAQGLYDTLNSDELPRLTRRHCSGRQGTLTSLHLKAWRTYQKRWARWTRRRLQVQLLRMPRIFPASSVKCTRRARHIRIYQSRVARRDWRQSGFNCGRNGSARHQLAHTSNRSLGIRPDLRRHTRARAHLSGG